MLRGLSSHILRIDSFFSRIRWRAAYLCIKKKELRKFLIQQRSQAHAKILGHSCSNDKNRHGLLGLTVKRLLMPETTETTSSGFDPWQCIWWKPPPSWKLVQTMVKKSSKFTQKITDVDDMMMHNLVKYLVQTRLRLWDIKITNF